MEETNTETNLKRYRISLVETVEQRGSIAVKLYGDKTITYYEPRASIPEEVLLKHYQTSKRINMAINSGLENARAVYNVYHKVSPLVTIVPSEKFPGHLEVTAEIPGEESYTIYDCMWDQK